MPAARLPPERTSSFSMPIPSSPTNWHYGKGSTSSPPQLWRKGTTESPGISPSASTGRHGRRECTHGDQGFLLRRGFFNAVGPFEESLPMLAETRFAEAVRNRGEWLLLPAEIQTSARRFEIEGLRERQTLNAIITNF